MTECGPKRLLTVSQVAELLQMSEQSIYRWVSNGILPSVKLGHRAVRIRPEDLEAFIMERRRSGEEDDGS